MSLNPNAQAWVDALRSGRFQQARYVLSNGMGHCCLGVACEVAIENGLDVPRRNGKPGEPVKYVRSGSYLPQRVAKWLGMRSPRGKFGPKEGETLAALNDEYGMSFAEIADFIEEHADALGVAA